MTRRRLLLGAVAALVLTSGSLMCMRVGARGRFATAYSTYGSGPDGTRALFLLSERLGARPVRWSQDLAQLPDSGMLVALGGCDGWTRRPLSRFESEELAAWVRAGGVLLVAGADDYLEKEHGVTLSRETGACDPPGLLGRLVAAERTDAGPGDVLEDLPDEWHDDPSGVASQALEEDTTSEQWAAAQGPLAGLGAIPLLHPARVDVLGERTSVRLLSLGGASAGEAIAVGRGHVLALASASPLQNRALADGDGGVLFARLLARYAPDGPVLFDEYHLGVGASRSLSRYARDVGVGAVVLQLLLVVGVLLWRRGARFGAALETSPVPPAGTASYVGGVAELYRKSADRGGVLAVIVRDALGRIARRHHLPSAEPEALARALRARHQERVATATEELAAIAASAVKDERHLMRSATQVDRILDVALRQDAHGEDGR